MQHSRSDTLSPSSVESRKRPTGCRARQAAAACVTLAATAALLAGCGGDSA